MPKTSMKLGLFDPGMTHLHRVGLAGLYMTLDCLNQRNLKFEGASWELDRRHVQLEFEDGFAFFHWLFSESFKTDKNGLIDFAMLKAADMGDEEKISYHKSVLNTFLQHGDTNDKEKNETSRSFPYENKTVEVTYRPLKWYYLQGEDQKPPTKGKSTPTPLEMLFDDKDHLNDYVQIKGLHFPGAVKRHSTLAGTEVEQTPKQVICLLYAPTASLYYQLSRKNSDGIFERKFRTAIVLPHIVDLKDYSRNFRRCLKIPVERLSANSLGDAGLAALIELKSQEKLSKLGVSGCAVMALGTAKWSEKQKTRTKIFAIGNIDERKLHLFDIACRCLPNQNFFIEKSKKDNTHSVFVKTSMSRGLIADNIASENDWFKDFCQLMKSKKASEQLGFERKELNNMVEKATWTHENDKMLVEAVHNALRSRFAEIFKRAGISGERPRIDRERERIRSSLMRAKNLQTLRAELADIFVRGGRNNVLQKHWTELLPLFTGSDWQRAKDLALLALASYASKDAEDDEPENDDENQGAEEEKA